MKYQGKRLYLYIGRNGFIIALDFDFRGKAYSIEYSLFFTAFELQ